jgi:hypothetical protein
MKNTDIRTEKDFLHDLSSPAGAIQLHLEHLREISKGEKVDFEKVKEMLEKAVSLVQKISELIAARREEIKGDDSL